MGKPFVTVKPVNHFEKDFIGADEGQRNRAIEVLRIFMEEIREVLSGCVSVVREKDPIRAERCATCAFNPATDDYKGFAPTAYGLLWTIFNDKSFACHEDHPQKEKRYTIEGTPYLLCAGFDVLRFAAPTEAYLVAKSVMEAIRRIVPMAGRLE